MTVLILTLQRLLTGAVHTYHCYYVLLKTCYQGTFFPPTTLMAMLTPETTTGCGEKQGQTMEEF